jgi:hypothetical protein
MSIDCAPWQLPHSGDLSALKRALRPRGMVVRRQAPKRDRDPRAGATYPRGQSVLLRGSKIDPLYHVIQREQRRPAVTACPFTSEDADLDAADGIAIACGEAGGQVLFGGTIGEDTIE